MARRKNGQDVAVANSVDKDVRISLKAGGFVVADVFRPQSTPGGKAPVLVTMGVYGKDVPFREFDKEAWKRSELKSGKGEADRMVTETPLPDYWVEAGYAVVRCDQPGSGDSPGNLDVFGPSAQEALFDAIEWAGTQPWSSGKVGLLGASYYGVMGWLVAARRPPHLAAFIPFQGFTDHYRDCVRHGGILTAAFVDGWYGREVLPRQFGAPTGTSKEKLSPAELAVNTAFPCDYREYLRQDDLRFANHPYYRERTADPGAVEAPTYVWANEDGFGLHLRGTIDGFERAEKAAYRGLRIYSGSEPDAMYSRRYTDAHQLFFDRFLKDQANGFDEGAPVQVTVRKGGKPYVDRFGTTYPLEGTSLTAFFLDADGTLSTDRPDRPGATSYLSEYIVDRPVKATVQEAVSMATGHEGRGASTRFATPPLDADLELIGPMRLHLTVSVDGPDADLFVAIREIAADGSEVAAASGAPVSFGWQRVSMRNEDPKQSTSLRAWHTYDRALPLDQGESVALDVNIWPAAWIVSAGHRLVIEIAGFDQRGSGEFKHPPTGPYAPEGGEPLDNGAPQPALVTIHTGGTDPSRLTAAVHLMPLVLDKEGGEPASRLVDPGL